MSAKKYFFKFKKKLLQFVNGRAINKIVDLFKNKSGIEIGGTTKLFVKKVPLYNVVKNLDGCNYATSTIWEGKISEGWNYNFYEEKMGYQYISEATDLKSIAAHKYDFLISSHCLEHCANPLKAIKEWLRVIKPGGYLLLILPDKRFTFDHNRKITLFEHLLDDLNNDINETDLTHFTEIIKLHDLSLDLDAGTIDDFTKRSLNNYQNRCLHHHVFDFKLLSQIFEFYTIRVTHKIFIKPYHQLIVGKKR